MRGRVGCSRLRPTRRTSSKLDMKTVSGPHVELPSITKRDAGGIEKADIHIEQRFPHGNIENPGDFDIGPRDLEPTRLGLHWIMTRSPTNDLEDGPIGQILFIQEFKTVGRIVIVLQQYRNSICGTKTIDEDQIGTRGDVEKRGEHIIRLTGEQEMRRAPARIPFSLHASVKLWTSSF